MNMKSKLANARALVVEDDHSWQQILSEILGDAGLDVDVADSLQSAADSLRAAPHRLAVVDLSLGGSDHHNQDGLAVLDAVRRYDPGCAAIMLTGFATVELAVSALTEHGAFTCLRKETFNRAQFRGVVSHALALAPPSTGERAPADAQAQAGESQPAAPGCLALVVEDDAGWRSILSELLADAGYGVHACSSFGEALGRLRREKYTLAVVDLALTPGLGPNSRDHLRSPQGRARPLERVSQGQTGYAARAGGDRNTGQAAAVQTMGGYRLLASTRAAGIPTIVVSGTATPPDIERAYAEHGIFAYLEKQAFDRRAFLSTVAEAQAAGQACSELDCLTDREREVLELLARGMTNKEIAEALVITTNTVKRHLKAIFEKLEIHTRAAAAAKAINAGVPAAQNVPANGD
jgi:RNA polymerase sigma factor (sigma-70 family)